MYASASVNVCEFVRVRVWVIVSLREFHCESVCEFQ